MKMKRKDSLYAAIEAGNDEVARRLIAAVPSLVGTKNMFQISPLHLAASTGREKVMEYLLTVASPELINARNFYGMAPLHIAVEQGHAKVVAQLLPRTSADIIRSSWKFGGPVLYDAAYRGQHEIVTLLLAAYPELIDDDTSEYPVLLRALTGRDNEDMVARILALRPAMAHNRFRGGTAALHYARSVKVVDMLLAACPELIDAVDKGGRSALYYAKDKAIAERLLEVRPELSRVVTKLGETALHSVINRLDCDSNNDPFIAKLLKLNPYALRAVTLINNRTPFHCAIAQRKYNLVEMLQEKLSLDEIMEAFHECTPQLEARLKSTMVARCECLLEWLYKDVVGTVYEYLGFDRTWCPPPPQMKRRSPTPAGRPVTRSLAKMRKLELQGPLEK